MARRRLYGVYSSGEIWELFDLINELEELLAEPERYPGERPTGRRHTIGAFFGGVRVVSATLSFLVVGVLFTAFDPGWLYDSLWVGTLVNVGVAFGATVVAMGLLLLVYPVPARAPLRYHMADPLVVMLGLVVGVPAALGVVALVILADVTGLAALWHHSIAAALVVGAIAAYVTAIVVIFALINVPLAVYTCLRHWFGAGNVHPTLPALATLVYALAQLALGLYATFAAHGHDAGIPTGVGFTVTVGGPACVAVFSLIELRLLAAESITLTWLPPHLVDEVISTARTRGDAADEQWALACLESLYTDALQLHGPDHQQTRAARFYLARWGRGST